MQKRRSINAHLAIATGAALLIPGAAESNETHFDLICRGTSSFGSLSKLFDPRTASEFAAHYRVDLAGKKWCIGDCTSTSDLAEVSERLIVFHRHEDKDGDEFAFVNRETGHYTYRLRSWLLDMVTLHDGSCAPAPFSGMPTRKF